jgi:hypothetical protein
MHDGLEERVPVVLQLVQRLRPHLRLPRGPGRARARDPRLIWNMHTRSFDKRGRHRCAGRVVQAYVPVCWCCSRWRSGRRRRLREVVVEEREAALA